MNRPIYPPALQEASTETASAREVRELMDTARNKLGWLFAIIAGIGMLAFASSLEKPEGGFDRWYFNAKLALVTSGYGIAAFHFWSKTKEARQELRRMANNGTLKTVLDKMLREHPSKAKELRSLAQGYGITLE